MIIISHRGCLYGPDKSIENTPDAIDTAIEKGFYVEIDIRSDGKNLYLGHDSKDIKIDSDFLSRRREYIVIHAKDINSIDILSRTAYYNWFIHDKDDMVLTRWGWIWCYPGQYSRNGVILDFNNPGRETRECFGVCTDYPILYRR